MGSSQGSQKEREREQQHQRQTDKHRGGGTRQTTQQRGRHKTVKTTEGVAPDGQKQQRKKLLSVSGN
jgi:hypothetical protein